MSTESDRIALKLIIDRIEEFRAENGIERQTKLTAFLYLIMRDHLPTGIIAKIIMDIDELDTGRIEYSNDHLRALAEDYAGRILDAQVPLVPQGGRGGKMPTSPGKVPSSTYGSVGGGSTKSPDGQ